MHMLSGVLMHVSVVPRCGFARSLVRICTCTRAWVGIFHDVDMHVGPVPACRLIVSKMKS